MRTELKLLIDPAAHGQTPLTALPATHQQKPLRPLPRNAIGTAAGIRYQTLQNFSRQTTA